MADSPRPYSSVKDRVASFSEKNQPLPPPPPPQAHHRPGPSKHPKHCLHQGWITRLKKLNVRLERYLVLQKDANGPMLLLFDTDKRAKLLNRCALTQQTTVRVDHDLVVVDGLPSSNPKEPPTIRFQVSHASRAREWRRKLHEALARPVTPEPVRESFEAPATVRARAAQSSAGRPALWAA